MDVSLGLGLFLVGCGVGALLTRMFYRGLLKQLIRVPRADVINERGVGASRWCPHRRRAGIQLQCRASGDSMGAAVLPTL